MISQDHVGTRDPGSQGGFTMIELLVVVAIVSILALIVTPLLLGTREKAWIASCDDNYVALSGELQNELDTRVRSGHPLAAQETLDTVVPRHKDTNPRNLAQVAYVDQDACAAFVPPQATHCQVFLCYDGQDTILTQQHNTEARSYRLTVQ